MKNEFKVGDKIKFICKRNEVCGSLTVGKTYEVLKLDYSGHPMIKNDRGETSLYMSYRFEKVNSLFEDIEKAKSMIGKTLKTRIGNIFTPATWGVGNQYSKNFSISKGDNAVYLEDADIIALLSDCEVANNTMKLTDDYNATLEGDIVKVGCQSIPIEKVKELLKLYEDLNP